MNKNNLTLRLAESAVMLAFAALLSFIPLVKLPFGGTITACSMLPVALIAYRHGTLWGLFTAFAFSLIEMLIGLDNLSYATSVWALIAIIGLDYFLAFTFVGLAGIFRKIIRNQAGALSAGIALVCVLRYIAHVISGCTVWAGVSIPSTDGLLYSMAYNATYMIPETLVTIAGAVFVSRLLDFRSLPITRAPAHTAKPGAAIALEAVAGAAVTVAAIFDIVRVFSAIQGEGGFDITLLSQVNWGLLGIVTLAAVVIGAALLMGARAITRRVNAGQAH